MTDIDGWERIRLMLAGGRVSGERSNARESKYYGRGGDPARHIKFESEKRTQGERMQAQKQKLVEAFHTQTPYQQLLSVWAAWMRLADHQHSLAEGHPQDTKEFMAAGEAVNAMVDDLPRHLWWAVRKNNGICTVWNFPLISLEDATIKAEGILTPKMMQNVATRRYFKK